MKRHSSYLQSRLLACACALLPALSLAQVPVDADGNVVGYEAAGNAPDAALGNEGIPLRDAEELRALVGPVALYPDDLLAIVLPASTYPLQIVQAARFLDELEANPALEPDESWDDSVVALLNYPEVVRMMNEDIDWTWQLGEAVVAQQTDVVDAIVDFRGKAYAAGNLKSDSYQTVIEDDGVIEISPVSEEVIYVPYYEPERVVVYQPRPVYYYYPRAYPVYYYPYPRGYAFSSGFFWGVTTAFTIGWSNNYLGVYHPTYYGHPYYGYNYWDTWWYRRPTITQYNNIYVNNSVNIYNRGNGNNRVVVNRYEQGDAWRPRNQTRLSYNEQRITRNTYYPPGRNQGSAQGRAQSNSGFAASNGSVRRDNVGADRQINNRAALTASRDSVTDRNATRQIEDRLAASRSDNNGRATNVRQAGTANPRATGNSTTTRNDTVREARNNMASAAERRQNVQTQRSGQTGLSSDERQRLASSSATAQRPVDNRAVRQSATPTQRSTAASTARPSQATPRSQPVRQQTTVSRPTPSATRAAPSQPTVRQSAQRSAPSATTVRQAPQRAAPSPSRATRPSTSAPTQRAAPSQPATRQPASNSSSRSSTAQRPNSRSR